MQIKMLFLPIFLKIEPHWDEQLVSGHTAGKVTALQL